MKRSAVALLGVAAVGAAGFGALTMAQHGDQQATSTPTMQSDAKPALALITSLPILFGESFGLDGGAAALPAKLGETYDLRSIAVADAASLQPYRLLLMAHPRAQPAEALVELDQWVRGGGRLLLLADPRLDWHSDRPLGDRLRPPPDFADTGLLGHWGLTLAGPTAEGPVAIDVGEVEILASSPGRLSSKDRTCTLIADGFVARCRIGAGQVTVIADADFLNVTGPDALDGPTTGNLDLVARELACLAR